MRPDHLEQQRIQRAVIPTEVEGSAVAFRSTISKLRFFRLGTALNNDYCVAPTGKFLIAFSSAFLYIYLHPEAA